MIRHTKSTSGRTHRLTHTAPDTGNFKRVPGAVHEVTLRYKTTPAFDDQVQGDLIRKFWREYPGVCDVIGRVPNGVQIDRGLDMLEATRETSTLVQAHCPDCPHFQRKPTSPTAASAQLTEHNGIYHPKRLTQRIVSQAR